MKISAFLKTAAVAAATVGTCAPTDAQIYAFGFSGNDGHETLTVNDAALGSTTISTSAQGWWSPQQGNVTSNTNYITGDYHGTQWNDFFVFSLAGLTSVTSATLTVNSYVTFGGPMTYTVYDVSTPIATLENLNASPNTGIYDDLGSGVSYGSFAVNWPNNTLVSLTLNAAGVAAINTAIDNGAKDFAVGGTVNAIATVPEPSTWTMMGVGFAGLAFVGYRVRRNAITVS